MRLKLQKTDPEAWKLMYGIEQHLATTGLSATHRHLIRMRASQLNGCAFCLNMHSKEARKDGETEQRLYLLSAWRETTLFTAEEKALLALTEEVTLIGQHGVSPATYQQAAALFDEHLLARALMAIVMINAWNRIAISTEMPLEA
ncbi:carboxymuconolactone decarboxylase family protein [Hymenobacter lucidus]|uniref:Carboxymuconolactone decarboxylase family protein n=1 Tax=Hymenobacter lucidus TaxID=2880930 RepID=A0ABS8AUA7_9BACT|nr:carboxymuconolactone decarboxylase family protein [Hymenobacter lucidus]MCB2409807.1 carboxymuconolactone decarboxylase family protein [Hymenobacter lucidus]